MACDSFFQSREAPKVDLYLIARAVSSPIGKGSDSKPLPITFGHQEAFLVDSAQFGMEPLVIQAFKMVYCYLPSFRGEMTDDRHLSQFYHCEAELCGTLEDAIEISESLLKQVILAVINAYQTRLFNFDQHNFEAIAQIREVTFPRIHFDEAVQELKAAGFGHLVEQHDYGRFLSHQGEIKLLELVPQNQLPLWLTHHDRDTVPFYQQPCPDDPEHVMTGDLLVPSING